MSKAPQESKDLVIPESRKESNASLNVNENLTGPIVIEAVQGINEQASTDGLNPKSLIPPRTVAAAPRLPALQRLQLAPSVISLGSIASSHFDVTCSNLDLLNT